MVDMQENPNNQPIEWFLRWEVSVRKVAVLQGPSSRICSKQHAASLRSFHAFCLSPSGAAIQQY